MRSGKFQIGQTQSRVATAIQRLNALYYNILLYVKKKYQYIALFAVFHKASRFARPPCYLGSIIASAKNTCVCVVRVTIDDI